MLRFQSIFPNGESEDIWKKLFVIYDYFAELEEYVGSELGITIDTLEVERVKDYIVKLYDEQRIQ